MDKTYPEILGQVMQADLHGLKVRWRKLGKRGDPQAEARWWEAARQSAARRSERRSATPPLSYDPQLPITAHKAAILEYLSTRQTIVVCGETGSGKSTQLPKMCLEAGLAAAGTIGHTQPRRLAARAVSSRLAEELQTSVGDLVGYKIRFSDVTAPQTLVKVMTDGILLAETQGDRFLDQYTALIIDEAHERSLNIDFLLGYLKRLRAKRPDLKIIITSATIDPQRFAEHFEDEQGPAPIVEVSGRTWPVEIRYRPLEQWDADEPERQESAIADAIDELQATGAGDVLVFLPTERDIRQASRYLRGRYTQRGQVDRYEILPLYARLTEAEQNRIFNPGQRTRIILSTNVAESSLTVPRIRYVVDSGLVRISRYAPRTKVQRLPIEPISQASANQRAGRCGRIGPGVCIRLYGEDDLLQRPRFTTPEIRRSDLASVLLQSMVLQLGPLEEFPLMDAPSRESIRDAHRTLYDLAAVDERQRLTTVGRKLGQLPCDPRIGRMLIEAGETGCLQDVLIVAAALECPDIRRRPEGQQQEADQAHARFQDPHSDFLGLIRLWRFCDQLHERLSRSRFRRAMSENYLSLQGYWQWRETHRQLQSLLRAAGYRNHGKKIELPEVEPSHEHDEPARRSSRHAKGGTKRSRNAELPAGYDVVHLAILSGLLRNVAQRSEGFEYTLAGGLKGAIWPGSGLFRQGPAWLVAAEVVETSQRFLRTVGKIDVAWLEQAAAHLLKHNYVEPHWSKKAGAAMVYRHSTLYGLPVVTRRRQALAPIDPQMARALMIEHGLVDGQWRCNESFYVHNREMLADVQELVHRTRDGAIAADRYDLIEFYNTRLPAEVTDLQTLRGWLRRNQGTSAAQALWMQPQDLVRSSRDPGPIDQLYPNQVCINGIDYGVEYHFEPGHPRDGVTITVPAAALRQIDPGLLEWLVPGMLEEKIQQLIRGLPKSKRTAFLPVPEVAGRLVREISDAAYQEPLLTTLSRAMCRHASEPVRPSDFDLARLPPHLRFCVRVVDHGGQEVAAGRDLEHLRREYAPATSHVDPGDLAAAEDLKPRRVQLDELSEIPAPRAIGRTGPTALAFPALVDCGQHVELRWLDNEGEARRLSQIGWAQLFALKHRRLLKSHIQHLPQIQQWALLLSHQLPGRDVLEELMLLTSRIAFLGDGQPPTTAADIDVLRMRAAQQVSLAAQEIASWLPKLAPPVHELRSRLERIPGSWDDIRHDIEQQIDALFIEDWMRHVPWRHLREYPRYLAAIHIRLERLPGGGVDRDRKSMVVVQRFWEQYQAMRDQSGGDASQEHLEELRWAIEEFRVAQFAQKLGTRIKVSEKRLQSMLV